MRKMINEIIRHTTKQDYKSRWSHLYTEYLYRYSVNIPTRAENRGMSNRLC